MLYYKIVRPHDEVIVSIFRNKNDNTYSFINLTKGHICPRHFLTVNEALMDLEKYKKEGKIIKYYPYEIKI